MTSRELEALARIGALKAEAPSRAEYDGLVSLGEARLTDAGRRELALASRFDLAYNAAHALALAALRRVGFRAGNRRVVFEALAHTTALSEGAGESSSSATSSATSLSTKGHPTSMSVCSTTSSARRASCATRCTSSLPRTRGREARNSEDSGADIDSPAVHAHLGTPRNVDLSAGMMYGHTGGRG